MAALDESLWQLGRTAWASLEGCLGAEPLRLLAEVSGGGAGGGARGGRCVGERRTAPRGPFSLQSLLAALWLTASAVSSGLAVLSGAAGDLLDACGLHGERGATWAPSRRAPPGPSLSNVPPCF